MTLWEEVIAACAGKGSPSNQRFNYTTDWIKKKGVDNIYSFICLPIAVEAEFQLLAASSTCK